MTTVPDVSVVVAVYNTMPYLTACLNSLVEQSIGRERLEVIAVDDGSTDASGKELDHFAELYPGTVKVIHQTNSGGPARPSNRALELATGRYVYFVGSDDYLGTEALERLVTAADTCDSDVVVGKMVGVNGRYVDQSLFKSTNTDVRLGGSALPWSLSNCKLFRRELVEHHGLRFRENMPVCSDQPFTIEACVRARRISVLADYAYYYAVRRTDSTNITFQTAFLTHLRAAEELIEFTVGLIGPGPERDAILRRHFTWELGKLLGEDFPDLDRSEQQELCAGIGRMAEQHLTPAVWDKLDLKRRIRVGLARHAAVDALCAAIRQDTEGIVPPIVLDGGRAYSRHPGFGDEWPAIPNDYFQITARLRRRIAEGLRATHARWERGDDGETVLAITVGTALLGADELDPATAHIGLVPSPRTAGHDRPAPLPVEEVWCQTAEDGLGTDLHARIPVGPLLAHQRGSVNYSVRLYVEADGATHEIPVPVAGPMAQLRRWHRARPHRVSAIANERDRLVIAIAPIRPLRVVRLRLRRLVNRGGRKAS
jgi:poly(ribitol-phosphate) beta-N-acetylglucosaminyltransferase